MIDLHSHTTISDGGDSPTELVIKAAAAGITALAVTNHDNDLGLEEAHAAGREHGVEVIRGVEISCDVENLESLGYHPDGRPTMHLLGYFIPEHDNPLTDELAELRHHRANRNVLIVKRLNELGIAITFEEVENEAGGPGFQIGRPHFAAVMVRNGAVPDYQAAFDQFLAKGAPGYVSRKLLKPVEAIELMRSAGVVPVFAHPFTMNLSSDELERFVDELVVAGLQGIEGYHGDMPEDQQEPFRALGRAKNLIVSGGSDYHGDMRPDRSLPSGKYNVTVPDEALDQIRSLAGALPPR